MPQIVERVQTGVRLEKKTLKVLRALADYLDMGLGDLIEGIVLHSFDGIPPFSAATRDQIRRLRDVYGLELGAADSHLLVEKTPSRPKRDRNAIAHSHHDRATGNVKRKHARRSKHE